MANNEKRLDISELDFDEIKQNLKTFLQEKLHMPTLVDIIHLYF